MFTDVYDVLHYIKKCVVDFFGPDFMLLEYLIMVEILRPFLNGFEVYLLTALGVIVA